MHNPQFYVSGKSPMVENVHYLIQHMYCIFTVYVMYEHHNFEIYICHVGEAIVLYLHWNYING